MASAKIYTGPWIDHSKSTLRAPTLTVSTYQALVLISFLAVFITIVGVHLWGIVRYTLHQFRHSSAPQDAMYHQEQAILRNADTPTGAVWEFFKLGFAWRRRAGYGFRRVVPLLCLAALQAGFFALAGVFSAGVLGGSSVVLVQSDSCGYISTVNAAVNSNDPDAYARFSAALTESKIAAEASAAYARACYGNSSNSAECSSFVVPQLPFTFQTVACPFANGTCLDGALRVDSGFIHTDAHLGINSAKEDAFAYRRVTTCAPIRTEGYSRWRTNTQGQEQYLDLLYSGRSVGSVSKRQVLTTFYDVLEDDAEDVDGDEEEVAAVNGSVDESSVSDEITDDMMSEEAMEEYEAEAGLDDSEDFREGSIAESEETTSLDDITPGGTLPLATTAPALTAVVGTTRPQVTGVVGHVRPGATSIGRPPYTTVPDKTSDAVKNITAWLDEPLNTTEAYAYTDEEETESFEEAVPLTGAAAASVPVTFTYDTDSADYVNTAYPLEHLFASLGDPASSTFTPISDLSSADADVTLIILTNNAQYIQPVEDVWFNATEITRDTSGFSRVAYTSTNPIAVMACTEQHQLCDSTLPQSQGCSALTGWATVRAAQRYTGAHGNVAADLSHAVSNSLLSSMFAQLGSSALLASLSVAGAESLHSAALPANQWQLEVEAWASYNLAHLQRLVASVATGPVLASSEAYITPPSVSPPAATNSNISTTASATDFSVCSNQKVLDANHHSFPIFHLSLTIAVGCIIILLNIFLAPLLGLIQTFTGFGTSRKEAWDADHVFQLQRMAYEGANLGTWNGSSKGSHVPTTVYSAVPERFGRPGVKGVYEAVDNEGDASGVYDENSLSDDEDGEKVAYGDGGKGYTEARKSHQSDRTSLAEEDLVANHAGQYRDGNSLLYNRGVDIGVKSEDEDKDETEQSEKKW